MNPQDYIPNPCHKNWENMTGDQQQKFCDECSCTVHNLHGMSHQQIATLKKQLGTKLCGSFPLQASKPENKSPLKRPLIIGASISTLAIAACQPTTDTTTHKNPTTEQTDLADQIADYKAKNKTKTTTRKLPKNFVVGLIALPPKDKQ